MTTKATKLSNIPGITFEEVLVTTPGDVPFVKEMLDGFLPAPDIIPNVAQGKPATADSSVTSGTARPPGAAVDGSNSSYWSSLDTAAYPRWLQVDLQGLYRISRFHLELAGSFGQTANNLKSFELQYSADGATGWTTVYSVTTNTASVLDLPLSPVVAARYWRVLVHENNGDAFSRIAELSLYGYIPIPIATRTGDLGGTLTTTQVAGIAGFPIVGSPALTGDTPTFHYTDQSFHFEIPAGTGGGGGTGGPSATGSVKVYADVTVQSIPSATETALTFDAAAWDTSNYFSPAVRNRLTVPNGKAGKYLITGSFRFDNTTGADQFATIAKNGVSLVRQEFDTMSGYHHYNLSTILDLAVGDYIELRAYHTSGSARTAQAFGAGDQQGRNLSMILLTSATGTNYIESRDINIAPLATYTADSTYAAGYEPAKVVDTDPDTTEWASADNTNQHWLQATFAAARTIHKWSINLGDSDGVAFQARAFSLQYYNGTTWINADVVTGNTTRRLAARDISPQTSTQWRVLITLNNTNDNIARITNLQLFEYQSTPLVTNGNATMIAGFPVVGAPALLGDTPAFHPFDQSFHFDIPGGSGGVNGTATETARLTMTANASFASGGRFVTFDTADFDTNGTMIDPAAKDRITIRKAGYYVISGALEWQDTGSTVHQISLVKNNAAQGAASNVSTNGGAGNWYQNVSAIVHCDVGDYIQLSAYSSNASTISHVQTISSLAVVLVAGTGQALSVKVIGDVTTQTIPNATETPVNFDSVVWDDSGFFNAATPSRLTIPPAKAGTYLVNASFRFEQATAADQYAQINVNGVGVARQEFDATGSTGFHHYNLSTLLRLSGGDYVEVIAYHNSGATRQIQFFDYRGRNFSLAQLQSGTGSVSGVTVSAPLASTGGLTPNISWNPAAAVPFNKQQLQGAALDNQATAPTTPATGQIYLDTVSNKVRAFIAAAWQDFVTGATALAGDVTGTVGATVVGKVNGIAFSGTPALNKYPAGVNGTSAAWGDLTLASYATDPASPAAGLIYLNSAGNKARAYINGAWQDVITSATAVGGDVSGTVGNIVLPTKGTPGTYAYPSQIITDSKGDVTGITAGTSPSATAVGGDVSGTVGNIVLPNYGGAGATVNNPSQIIYNTKGAIIGATAGNAPSEFETVSQSTGSTIAACKAVAYAATGAVKLADSGVTNDFPVIGFTVNSIASAASGLIQTSGLLAGFAGLTAGAIYFSDPATPGGITATVPTTAAQKHQVVGRAISATTLLISLEEPITLNGASATSALQRSASTGRLLEGAFVQGLTYNAPFGNSGTAANPVPTLALDTTHDGGAIIKQAATPGTAQGSTNGHIDGSFIADTLLKSPTVNGSTTVQVAGANVNPVPRNWIINGNMDVCQRYGPGGSAAVRDNTALAALSPARTKDFVLDRWAHKRDGSGATVTVSQQAFTIGQTAVPGEPTYFLRHNQTVAGSGGTLNYIQQWIEDVRTLAGQTITISGYLTADAARTVSVRYRQFFGTGGSADVTPVSSVAVNVTTTVQKWTATFTLPSISGKTITADSALILEFVLPNNTVMTIDLAQVQLEAGANAGPFQKKTVAEELFDCYRYYLKSFLYGVVPASNPGSFGGAWYAPVIVAGAVTEITKFPLVPSMRVAPNLTFYNPGAAGSGAYNTATSTSSGGNVTVATSSEKDVLVTVLGVAGWNAGNPWYFHWTAEDPIL